MKLRRMATAVAATIALTLGASASAFAQPDPIEWTGQGTSNGVCNDVQTDDAVPDGRQIWHFVLNQQRTDPGGATMDATFDDGTTVAGQEPGQVSGQVAHFFVESAEGATLLSATAYPAGNQGPNPQFVVSHCVVGKDGNGDNGNGDENGKDDENGNGKDDENGNGKDDENGDENGEKPADGKTPAPVPTSVPAGAGGSAAAGPAGTIGLLAMLTVAVAAGAALVRRRLGYES
jgi:hypothetical protein